MGRGGAESGYLKQKGLKVDFKASEAIHRKKEFDDFDARKR